MEGRDLYQQYRRKHPNATDPMMYVEKFGLEGIYRQVAKALKENKVIEHVIDGGDKVDVKYV